MKKLCYALIAFMCLTHLTGCSGGSTTRQPSEEEIKKAREKEELQKFVDAFDFEVIKDGQVIGERNNETLPKIKRTPIGQLTNATGWRLCEGNQWASRKNRIPVDHTFTSPTIADYGEYALGSDNFISLKLHEMTYGDKEYLILIKIRKSGSYLYPNIREGWRLSQTASYWVMNKSELEAFNAVQDKEPVVIGLKALVKGETRHKTAFDGIERDIVIEAEKEPIGKPEYNMLDVILYPDKAGNKVLFYLDGSFYKLGYNDETLNHICIHKGEDYLKERYYEATYTDFNKLFKLP